MNNTITPIIGIEVHVELTTRSKMFCGCPADHFGKKPNTQTCPVCLGLPGALPVPNQKAIEDTIMIGLALNCEINEETHFDRKQYFYPDLSKGYQISQYDQPLCHDGYLTLDSGKKIRIERVHLEEDTGKLQHITLNSERVSLIDFNRSGVPLVEIVSMPDISSTEEAKEYLKKIHQIVREIKVTTADLEKGQMRLEPTVNVRITDEKGDHFTPLVELKNINSFNFATLAIDYEVKRLVAEFEKTGLEKQGSNKSTRGYDSVRKVTFPQRQKEEAKDYRYFPEPDIPPLRISNSVVEKIRSELPKSSDEERKEWTGIGVRPMDINILLSSRASMATLSTVRDSDLFKTGEINIGTLGTALVNRRIEPSEDIMKIKKQYIEMDRVGETDTVKLSAFVEQIIEQNPKVVEEYKKGKTSVLGFLIGAVMKLSAGKADPKTVSSLFLRKLSGNQS